MGVLDAPQEATAGRTPQQHETPTETVFGERAHTACVGMQNAPQEATAGCTPQQHETPTETVFGERTHTACVGMQQAPGQVTTTGCTKTLESTMRVQQQKNCNNIVGCRMHATIREHCQQ